MIDTDALRHCAASPLHFSAGRRSSPPLGAMTEPVARVFIVSLVAALAACAEPKCGGSDTKYYDQAIAYHLAKRGVPYKIASDGMVCVDGKYASDLIAADREAAKYFHEVADLLKDSCEEQAIIEWATRKGLRFEVRDTYRLDGSPSGRMFLLRSFAVEELAANRRLLDEAPRGASCAETKK